MAWVPIITTNLPPHLASFKGFVEAQGGAVAAGDARAAGQCSPSAYALPFALGPLQYPIVSS